MREFGRRIRWRLHGGAGDPLTTTPAERKRGNRREAHDRVARLRAPGLLLGIGLGGLVEGIVLHQILQWHHMLTSEGSYPDTTVAGLETNTLWDGLFHAATWVAVTAGIYLLWRRIRNWRRAISGRALLGWMLVGWGLFNLVEGIVDHQILDLHHVREGTGHQTAYDLGFLALGALLAIGGWLIAHTEARKSPPGAMLGFGPSSDLVRCDPQLSELPHSRNW